ncbi:GntR family transcriptional regulator [Xenorhabdus budapestensis]|uniref:GntR family transcriptional regulator n=1 Tax=Xenorhabdus budapestensis TaxID=290110 RepID=A0A2D0IQV3_XENBU|nr:GntR family transcriptional regulator [Xenorhabdus budapestensis]PHM24270.1 GntR family transcriptional regulator [Xenorhabdus budapestensis]
MKRESSPQILSKKIAEIIRNKLVIGELLPGQRLSEAILSEQLKISRNTLREVFRTLTQEGLLKHQPNRGVFVAIPDIASIIDIYRVRKLIECQALMQAYPMHPAVTKMREAVTNAQQCQNQQDWVRVGTANMCFHAAIVELTDSERLMTFYRNISAELRLAFGLLNEPELLYAPYVDKNTYILELLDSNQTELAAQKMEDYLDLSERTVLAAYSRKNNG